MAIGVLWALVVIWVPQQLDLPFLPPPVALPVAFLAPGFVLAAMIGRLAQRRFFDTEIIDGQVFAPGSGAATDQKVLTNTVEQLVLALVTWPFVAMSLGGAAVIVLGLSFALMRGLFWVGYHMSPPLRGVGFAGTFYPTVLSGFWALVAWFV
ncbi:MAPEG family protein [Falsiphaeobacter marinintestinus]|uniref:MAPEG family protein n=1 Tax=Falsiphaeobacter marinintestinus TaxID=1492905 RepID=UPI0011B5F707|nr:MAPEG family protein [Phaeobacter marinintestinus]